MTQPLHAWIYQPCSAQGCSVMIRSPLGHQWPGPPVCRWCMEKFEQKRKVKEV